MRLTQAGSNRRVEGLTGWLVSRKKSPVRLDRAGLFFATPVACYRNM